MPPFSRRDLLKAAAAASLVPLIPACSDGSDPDAESPAARFEHGVASGDPLSDALILWTRVMPLDAGAESVPVRWRIARDAALSEAVGAGLVSADADSDYTVKVDVRNLQPGTVYYYQFSVGENRSPVGRSRTAPVGGIDRLRFAFVTCGDYARGLFNAYRRVAERNDLQAVVHLGD